jgi:hypothetical protein
VGGGHAFIMSINVINVISFQVSQFTLTDSLKYIIGDVNLKN